MIEVQRRGIFNSVLVTSVLEDVYNMWDDKYRERLTRYCSSLNMNGVMAQLALVQLPV